MLSSKVVRQEYNVNEVLHPGLGVFCSSDDHTYMIALWVVTEKLIKAGSNREGTHLGRVYKTVLKMGATDKCLAIHVIHFRLVSTYCN